MKARPIFSGMEGGFEGTQQQYRIETAYSIVVLPAFTFVTLDTPDISEKVIELNSWMVIC